MTFEELGLEQDCPKCSGTKFCDHTNTDGQKVKVYCGHCNATGVVPSQLGEQVLEFVRKNTRRFG